MHDIFKENHKVFTKVLHLVLASYINALGNFNFLYIFKKAYCTNKCRTTSENIVMFQFKEKFHEKKKKKIG